MEITYTIKYMEVANAMIDFAVFDNTAMNCFYHVRKLGNYTALILISDTLSKPMNSQYETMNLVLRGINNKMKKCKRVSNFDVNRLWSINRSTFKSTCASSMIGYNKQHETSCDNYKCFVLLLAQPAINPKISNTYGTNTLSLCICNGKYEFVRFLLNKNNDLTKHKYGCNIRFKQLFDSFIPILPLTAQEVVTNLQSQLSSRNQSLMKMTQIYHCNIGVDLVLKQQITECRSKEIAAYFSHPILQTLFNSKLLLGRHLGLSNLILLYNDNSITIDGKTDLSFTENVIDRFKAHGQQTYYVENGSTDLDSIERAILDAQTIKDKPWLIQVRTNIGDAPLVTDVLKEFKKKIPK